MIRVVFSGSRVWSDFTAVHDVLERLSVCMGIDNVTFYHGAQVGLDTLVHTIATYKKLRVHGIPADFDTLGNKAGPIRNRELLSYDPALVVAYPLPMSKGTVDMINECKRRKIPLFVYKEPYFESFNTVNLDETWVNCFKGILYDGSI